MVIVALNGLFCAIPPEKSAPKEFISPGNEMPTGELESKLYRKGLAEGELTNKRDPGLLNVTPETLTKATPRFCGSTGTTPSKVIVVLEASAASNSDRDVKMVPWARHESGLEVKKKPRTKAIPESLCIQFPA